MGLDMFLHKRTYVLHYGKHDERPHVTVDYPNITVLEWTRTQDDWIRRFVGSNSDLQKLLDTVNQVLADHSLASALLPTQGGFFFGNTEYGEDYFHDLTLTKKICQTELANAEGGDFYYEANW
jgi:hypothetical protein